MAAVNLSYHSPLIAAASSSLTSSPDFSLSPKLFLSPNRHFQSLYSLPTNCFITPSRLKNTRRLSATAMATGIVQEVLPPALDSSSEPPPIFDGTTRLYISYTCPYAQRTWITRNYKGLQDKIKLVPIDLQNRPDWYKEKVYPPNKVPSLEHNNEVKGESLDLIKYIDSNFEGPSLSPDDPAKKEFAEELFSYTDLFNRSLVTYFKTDGIDEAAAALDYIETALSKFDDGPFFLGEFSLVDIAYAPFIERFQPFALEVKNYDITSGRPKLSAWIEEMDKIDGFRQTSLSSKPKGAISHEPQMKCESSNSNMLLKKNYLLRQRYGWFSSYQFSIM